MRALSPSALEPSITDLGGAGDAEFGLDTVKRPPLLSEAVPALRGLVGDVKAKNLVNARPTTILENCAPTAAPPLPPGALESHKDEEPFFRRVSRYFRV